MDTRPNKYLEALNSGYTDQAIAEHLASPEKIKDALDNGYSYGEIARYLSGINEGDWTNGVYGNKVERPERRWCS